MSNLTKWLGIDKGMKLWQIIQHNGGVKASLLKLYRMDDLKIGKLVGVDKYGNQYYENPYYFYGRNRWVEYAPHINTDYDASQVPAEWYGWLHYKTDLTPLQDGHRPQYKWMSDHSENLTGTKYQYMPFTTVRPKIQEWKPPSKDSK